ncbi:MAG: carnitine 3-dehydrogenase [Salaquimonas sp.]
MKTAAIIGGGVIGGGWAARFLINGWNVIISDPDPEAERKISEVLANARRSLPALSDVVIPVEGKLSFAASLAEAVKDADWIQESVPERLEIKHKVFAEIQANCRKDALIGSSTSGFKPSELQQGTAKTGGRSEQIFVAHPFNPVYLLPLIELVGDAGTCALAKTILEDMGMKPLIVRKEIDAHIADRFLEAVWREALWLVKDGIANTEEIDDAIRFGFGLRWAQMGLFETYRIAGGEAGMRHFLEQFGPCLTWPWTKLMDVPEFNDELVDLIAGQSDEQSGKYSIRELERIRDDNLVAMMRSLKTRNYGAGALLNDYDAKIRPPLSEDLTVPLRTVERVIPIDWTDYNGHMNESRYGHVFTKAGDGVMEAVGADEAYIDDGLSYFTVDNHIRYHAETNAGDAVYVDSWVIAPSGGKKLRMHHEMRRVNGELLSSCTQFLLHVSLETRKSCEPPENILDKLERLVAAHKKLNKPESLPDSDWEAV